MRLVVNAKSSGYSLKHDVGEIFPVLHHRFASSFAHRFSLKIN